MGYRQYPVYLKVSQTDQGFQCTMGTEVLYSSTCPCSAALARQLIQESFAEKFAASQVLTKGAVLNWLGQEDSIVAVPHSQRSLARVLLRMNDGANLDFIGLIDRLEGSLKTPVQAAVKRVDEQEFARLNGQNLMFCEDAARRLQGEFVSDSKVLDYYIHVEHQESLHPHEAVSRVVKGVPGGFVAEAMPAL
jgi:GTP cyclohydrolase I